MINYVFKRYELKYLITYQKYQEILPVIKNHLEHEKFNNTTIQSLYYDTKDYLLIRRSMDKPKYKEKLRLRSYGLANSEDKVFLEIKKKYDGIVYKRRVALKEEESLPYIYGYNSKANTQIEKEIAYFKRIYPDLRPMILLLYDREAYEKDGLRITFDTNIRYRQKDLSLSKGLYGTKILNDDYILMEVKVSNALPMWLATLFSENHIYKTSFSKYGEAYKTIMKEKENEKWNNSLNQYLTIQP